MESKRASSSLQHEVVFEENGYVAQERVHSIFHIAFIGQLGVISLNDETDPAASSLVWTVLSTEKGVNVLNDTLNATRGVTETCCESLHGIFFHTDATCM